MELTEGNLWKKIMVYSLPLVITNMLELLFNIADVAIVGRFAGSLSLGAVGSTTLLITLTTGWLIGISNGVNAVVAFYAGAEKRNLEKKAIQNGFFLCLAIGILTFLFGFLLASPILQLLGTKEELIREATLYFKIYMIGSPALAMFNFGNGVLSAEGNTKDPLKYLTIAGILNIILNLVFVLKFHMTADGVAYASIISQYLSAALVLLFMFRTKQPYHMTFQGLKFDGIIIGKILRVGIPTAIQYSMFAVANLFVQSAVNTFDHIVVEGNSAAMNFDNLVYTMMAAFYTACTSFIAQNYGASKRERVLYSYLITTAYSFGLAVILGALIFIFRGKLLYVFTKDADVVAAGCIRLGILSVSYCLSAFMDNCTAACRGLGKTIIPTIIVLIGSIAFRVLWIYTIFAHFRTLQSLYPLYGCAFVLAAIFQNIYFFHTYRKIFKVRVPEK